jgi:hypothetical protein
MTALIIGVLAFTITPGAQGTTSLSEKRHSLKPEVLVTTLSADELAKRPLGSPLEHNTEVARTDTLTLVLTIGPCEKGSEGTCNVSADVITYKPDGTVHSEQKNVAIKGDRAMVPLKFAATDATGLYRVVATVRDLNARRFAQAERIFGVR